MTSRILPPEEWPRLAGTEAETLWPRLLRSDAQIMVVEDGHTIIATWIAIRVVHAECLWIAPSHRGRFGVAMRLLRGMARAAGEWGATSVWTGSLTEQVTQLIHRLGGSEVPGKAFLLPLKRSG